MATTSKSTSLLTNPLATVEQLSSSGSQLDGVPADLEDSVRFAGAVLTQAAGVLLRLPQEVIAQAIVSLSRFWTGAEGGSLLDFGMKDVSAAAIFLTAKLSAYPRSPRSVINVYEYLDSRILHFVDFDISKVDASSYYVSEGNYQSRRNLLWTIEGQLLRVLGFETQTSLPHPLCINYMQTLDVFSNPKGYEVASRAFSHLNSALMNPQLLYLTHQPTSLAVAAIYLAAREIGVKLPEVEWWEVFDVDREELGFLVVALRSFEGFVKQERANWDKKRIPLTTAAIKLEIERREAANGDS